MEISPPDLSTWNSLSSGNLYHTLVDAFKEKAADTFLCLLSVCDRCAGRFSGSIFESVGAALFLIKKFFHVYHNMWIDIIPANPHVVICYVNHLKVGFEWEKCV